MTTIGQNQPCPQNPLWSTSLLGSQCDVMYRGTGSLIDLKYHDFVKKLEILQDSYAILDENKWRHLYVKSKRGQRNVNKRSMIRLYIPEEGKVPISTYELSIPNLNDNDNWKISFYALVFRQYVDGPLAYDYIHAFNNKVFCYPWKLTDSGKNQAAFYLRNRARIGTLAERTELIPLKYDYDTGNDANNVVRWVDFIHDFDDTARWNTTKDFWYRVYLQQVLLREIARKVIAPNIAAYAAIHSRYNQIMTPPLVDYTFDKYTFYEGGANLSLMNINNECISQSPDVSIQTERNSIDSLYYTTCQQIIQDNQFGRSVNIMTPNGFLHIMDALSSPNSKRSKELLKGILEEIEIKDIIVRNEFEPLVSFYRFNALRRSLLEIYTQIKAAQAINSVGRNNTLLQAGSIKTEDMLSFSTYATLRKMMRSVELVQPTMNPFIGVSSRALDHIIGLYCETTTKCQSAGSRSRKLTSTSPSLDIVVTKIALPDTTNRSQMQSIKSFSDIVKPLHNQNQLFMIDVTKYTNGLAFYRHAPGPVFASKLLQHIEECSTFNGENLMRSEIITIGKNNHQNSLSTIPIGLQFAPRHSVYTVLTNDGKIIWILDRKQGKVAIIAPQWKLSHEYSRTASGVKAFHHNDADIFFAIRNGLMPPPISFSNIQHNFREEYLNLCKNQIAKDTNDTGLLYKVMLDSNKPVCFNIDSKTGKTYMDQFNCQGRREFKEE